MYKNYGKGSIGTSMGLIRVKNGREIKKKAPKRCDCKKCIHAIIKGECVTCYITGEVAVNKKYCHYYKTNDMSEQEKKKVLKKQKKRYRRKSNKKKK